MLISFVAVLGFASGPCRPAPAVANGHAALAAAAAAVGLPPASGRVLQVHGYDVTVLDEQSDRTYPPFISAVSAFDEWFDPSTGTERRSGTATIAGMSFPEPTTLGSASASYIVHDTAVVPSEQTHASLAVTRPLDVWAVLRDWLEAPDVRVLGTCVYRDYPRLVLSRTGQFGTEQLYLDERYNIPIKLDRIEPHYLWGQVHVEYVYSTWRRLGAAYLPGVSFRQVDGRTSIERTYGETQWMAADSAPRLSTPPSAKPMGYPLPAFLAPTVPDTTRIGPQAFVLRNYGYGETVMLARDTVYVLDATQGEARARADSAWIGRLFPGRHPLVVVATDLAWPHVAGLRYWVAQGATIVAHRAAGSFLRRVVDRRWTRAPDLLERRRRHAHFRFVGVGDTLRLGGGDLLLFAIDGRTTEVALAAYDRPLQYLWASDYIQQVSSPSAYLDDVWDAVRRHGLNPKRVSAEHLRLTPWASISRLAPDQHH